MNITVISQYFHPEHFRINEIVAELVNYGCNIKLITGYPNYPHGNFYSGYKRNFIYSVETIFGADVIRCPIFPRRKNAFMLLLNYISFIVSSSIYILFNLSKLRNTSVIFVYGVSPIFQCFPAIFLSKILNKPLILNLQDLWPESLRDTGYIQNKFILKLVKYFVKLIYLNCDLILCSSKPFVDKVHSIYPSANAVYWPNSVNNETIFNNIKTRNIVTKHPVNFVFAGNLGKAQGLDIIIDAFNYLKNNEIVLNIYGDGIEKNKLIKRSNNKNIFFHGQVPYKDIAHNLSEADILILTLVEGESLSYTVPNKLQAYLAIGRPILIVSSGEAARIVSEANCGFIVSNRNVFEISQIILQIINTDFAQLDKYSENAYMYYKNNYDHKKLIQELLAIFNQYSP
jgi:glycosyltransferase involved in cell wall biosynthesis